MVKLITIKLYENTLVERPTGNGYGFHFNSQLHFTPTRIFSFSSQSAKEAIYKLRLEEIEELHIVDSPYLKTLNHEQRNIRQLTNHV